MKFKDCFLKVVILSHEFIAAFFFVILFTWCLIPVWFKIPQTQFQLFSPLELVKGSHLFSTYTSWLKCQGMTSKNGRRFFQMPCTLRVLEPPRWMELPQRKERRRRAHCRRCVMFSQRCNIHWKIRDRNFSMRKTTPKDICFRLFSSVLSVASTDLQSTWGPRCEFCIFEIFFEAAHLGYMSKFHSVEGWLKISGSNRSPKSIDFPLNMQHLKRVKDQTGFNQKITVPKWKNQQKIQVTNLHRIHFFLEFTCKVYDTFLWRLVQLKLSLNYQPFFTLPLGDLIPRMISWRPAFLCWV